VGDVLQFMLDADHFALEQSLAPSCIWELFRIRPPGAAPMRTSTACTAVFHDVIHQVIWQSASFKIDIRQTSQTGVEGACQALFECDTAQHKPKQELSGCSSHAE